MQHDRIVGVPLDRGVQRGHATAFLIGPVAMPGDEDLRLAARSATRNRDAQRAIGTEAKDVLSCAPDPDEFELRF